jgi:hypothetical protein
MVLIRPARLLNHREVRMESSFESNCARGEKSNLTIFSDATSDAAPVLPKIGAGPRGGVATAAPWRSRNRNSNCSFEWGSPLKSTPTRFLS